MTRAMRAAAEPRALIDPVCGAPVGLDSLYRRAHGGALFVFAAHAAWISLRSIRRDLWP